MIRRREMLSLRTIILAALALSCLILILPTSKTQAVSMVDKRYRMEIHNHSRYVIYSIYMSHSYETGWGRDLLDDTLNPSHYLPIENITPGDYDFLIIDEHKRKCMVRDFRIFEDKTWEIDDDWLSGCKR
jgi:hypothetical protein